MITALAGGVGASKLLKGLIEIIKEEDLNIVVNTGDDIEVHGLHISPDLDIVMYTLAGIVDPKKGWGIKEDIFNCLEMLGKYGLQTWFNLGDKDLATHIYRTYLLKNGYTLSEITKKICKSLGVKVNILPMSDDKVQTIIFTEKGNMHFEEYLIKRQSQDKVLDVKFEGIEKSRPAKGVIHSILKSHIVILCPSNPIVSINPILSVPGIRKALKATKAKVIGVTPIVGGTTIKGPADKLMRGLGFEVSPYGVALLYRDFLDNFIIDNIDEKKKNQIENLGIKVKSTNTIMKNITDKVRLAREILNTTK